MLILEKIGKKYGELTVFEDFSLSVEEGETLAILGDSGAGKTTLLNLIAGLTDFEGTIRNLPERTGYIFQEDRLVPHFTVLENLKLVATEESATSALRKAGLADFAKEYPARLSAGMKRRVAILRAFLYDAPLLLMDEPFRNLDLTLKYTLMDFFRQLRLERDVTALFVTHDVEEAVCLAQRAIVLEKGKIVQDIKIGDGKETSGILRGYFLEKRT